jgi:hypothetical protein
MTSTDDLRGIAFELLEEIMIDEIMLFRANGELSQIPFCCKVP